MVVSRYAVAASTPKASRAALSSPPYRRSAYDRNQPARSTASSRHASSLNSSKAAGSRSVASGMYAVPTSALPGLSRQAVNRSVQRSELAPSVVRPPKFGMVPKAYGAPPQSRSRSVTESRSDRPSTISTRSVSMASSRAGTGLVCQPRITHVASGRALWSEVSTARAASGTGTSPASPPSCSRSILKWSTSPKRSLWCR